MALEIAKDKVNLDQLIGQKREIISIDGDVIVNDIKPDVLKVLNTNGVICVYRMEVLNGKIKLEGCVNTYIIYLADDEEGSIRTINTSLDFAEIMDIENCKEGMTIKDNIVLKGFETKIINGRKLHVRAFIDVDIELMQNEEIEMVINMEDDEDNLEIKNCNKKVLSLIGENTGKTTLKDTINIDNNDEIAEIMKVSFSFSNIENKISYNKVLIKSDVNVGIMYLTEDNRINEMNATIPLMGFIDIQNITDTSKCVSNMQLKNLILRQNNDENHSIYIEADVDLSCRVFEEREYNMIEDAYSTINDISFTKATLNIIGDEINLKDIIEIKEKLSDPPELKYGKILGISIIPQIEDFEIKEGSIKYGGILNTEFIVESESAINTINKNIPFNYEFLSDSITRESNVQTNTNVLTQKIQMTDDGPILVIQLELNSIVTNNEKISLIKAVDIQKDSSEDKDKYSMVIYFVKPGDTLWKIAKEFKSKVSDIAKINNIEDESKIHPGQQLYIPKFTRSQIAI